jgi:hypothetical protein
MMLVLSCDEGVVRVVASGMGSGAAETCIPMVGSLVEVQ